MTTDALGTGGGVTSANDHRMALASLVGTFSTGILDARTGVMVGPGSLNLVTGTSATGTMTVNVAPFQAVTQRNAAGGVYLGPVLEAATTVPIAAAPGSNSRIDVIYVKQQDADATVLTPDATTAPIIGVQQGTAAAIPAKPAIPVGALELATVTVAAGATSTAGAGVTISNTVRQTTARGGIRVAGPGSVVPGSYIGEYRDEPTNWLQRWDGSTWKSVFASLPTGLVEHGISTTAQTATATPVRLVNGLPFSANLVPNRAYEYTAELRAYSTVAGDIAAVAARVTLGAGAVAATDPQIASATAVLTAPSSADQYPLMVRRVFQVSTAGPYIFSLWANRAIGTGTLTFNGTADGTMTHQVKDIGVARPTVPFPV